MSWGLRFVRFWAIFIATLLLCRFLFGSWIFIPWFMLFGGLGYYIYRVIWDSIS